MKRSWICAVPFGLAPPPVDGPMARIAARMERSRVPRFIDAVGGPGMLVWRCEAAEDSMRRAAELAHALAAELEELARVARAVASACELAHRLRGLFGCPLCLYESLGP